MAREEAVEEASKAVAVVIKALRTTYPELVLVCVVTEPGGGGAVVTGHDNSAMKYEELERSHQALRMARQLVGRALWQNPLDAAALDKEVGQIQKTAHQNFADFKKAAGTDHKSVCGCGSCRVREAGALVLTAAHMLASIDVPTDALNDLVAVGKETCRRAHLKIVELQTRGQA